MFKWNEPEHKRIQYIASKNNYLQHEKLVNTVLTYAIIFKDLILVSCGHPIAHKLGKVPSSNTQRLPEKSAWSYKVHLENNTHDWNWKSKIDNSTIQNNKKNEINVGSSRHAIKTNQTWSS